MLSTACRNDTDDVILQSDGHEQGRDHRVWSTTRAAREQGIDVPRHGERRWTDVIAVACCCSVPSRLLLV